MQSNSCGAAALEASNRAEIHAHFRVAKTGDDWTVTVEYTVSPGYVLPSGSFSTVVITPDWSVKRMIGGA